MRTLIPEDATMMITADEHISHAEILEARDNAVYVVVLLGTAKVVRNGRTVARACAYTNGTFEVIDANGRIQMASWEIAAAWLNARAAAEILTASAAYLVNFQTEKNA